MATTTNFGWETPDDTDLVKDGALAMRTLGNSIDASFVDLKGGTTGQVLAKASNTDLDYTWVTQDDANAIQNAIVDAKGDLIAASAADTPARLAVGNNGETLVADSSASTGLRWQANFCAGKNAIINGDFRIWQRGTSFTPSVNNATYIADRFFVNRNGSGATVTVSQQSFTPGTAPVAGYENPFFYRYNQSVAGTGATYGILASQRIEDVRTFAGQTITWSFWAKADSSRTVTTEIYQDFGSGGSTAVGVTITSGGNPTLTTSWARYSVVATLPSLTGKTIGTGSFLSISLLDAQLNATKIVDTFGWQVEIGNVATPFQTATGTLAGELAACQRYLPALIADTNSLLGYAISTTQSFINFPYTVTPRVKPTGITVSNNSHFTLYNSGLGNGTPTTIAFESAGTSSTLMRITTSAGTPAIAQNQPIFFQCINSAGSILFTGCEL